MITQEQFSKLNKAGVYYFDTELSKTVDDNDYWTILRALWIESGICNDTWEKLFFKSGRKREHKIMKSSDRQALKKLPKKVTIYRVCREKADEEKWNWTTNREFAERYLCSRDEYIAEKIIDKSEIFAYFNSRKEFEVILKKKY
jgi:hypothetical protein